MRNPTILINMALIRSAVLRVLNDEHPLQSLPTLQETYAANPSMALRLIKANWWTGNKRPCQAVTPLGGLVSLFAFFNKIGLPPKLAETMPFTLHSPNAIPPAHIFMAFGISVVAGTKRFAHADWLRFDKALHAMLGIPRFPGADTVRNLFARFNQRAIDTFWRPLWRWLLPPL